MSTALAPPQPGLSAAGSEQHLLEPTTSIASHEKLAEPLPLTTHSEPLRLPIHGTCCVCLEIEQAGRQACAHLEGGGPAFLGIQNAAAEESPHLCSFRLLRASLDRRHRVLRTEFHTSELWRGTAGRML